MKTNRIKVIVKDGFEERFIEFCERFNINYKQYPKPLKTRFGVDDNSALKNFDGIESIEDMPIIN